MHYFKAEIEIQKHKNLTDKIFMIRKFLEKKLGCISVDRHD